MNLRQGINTQSVNKYQGVKIQVQHKTMPYSYKQPSAKESRSAENRELAKNKNPPNHLHTSGSQERQKKSREFVFTLIFCRFISFQTAATWVRLIFNQQHPLPPRCYCPYSDVGVLCAIAPDSMPSAFFPILLQFFSVFHLVDGVV